MKKTIEYMQLWLLAGMLLAVGCTADFEDLNRNPNQVTDSQMDVMNYKTGTKVKALQSLVVPVQEHMYQFNESLVGGPFGGYIGATVDTWRTKFETFNPSADWRNGPCPSATSSRRLTPPTAVSSTVRRTRWPSPSPNCCAWPSCTA